MPTTPSGDYDDDEVAPEGAAELSTFAGRLDYLFRTVHPRGQRAYSYDHVAEAMSSQGIDISGNYIWMLRSGRRNNPTLRHMEGLARFFGVSPAFLSDQDEAERVSGQLTKISELAASGVQHVAMRGASVEASTLDAITALLDQVRELTSGLRADTPTDPPSLSMQEDHQ